MKSNFVVVQKSLVNFLDLDENTGQLQAKGCMYLCSMQFILAIENWTAYLCNNLWAPFPHLM